MKMLFPSLFLGLWLGCLPVAAAEQKLVYLANKEGIVDLTGAPDHVVALVKRVRATNMNDWLLSEDKNVRWRVTKVQIVQENLVMLDLCDGNSGESVLFDRNWDKMWSIIRREPEGDTKPLAERKGERLTVLPFIGAKGKGVPEVARSRL